MHLTMHRKNTTKMLHDIKTEEDTERASRRAFLYSIPSFKSSTTGMAGSTTATILETQEQPSRPHPRPIIRLRLRASGPKRLKLRGPRPVPRINCRYSIPGSNSKMYVHRGKRYECPERIEPWRSDQKWMLDSQGGVFKKFAWRVKLAGATYYYVPEEAMTDSSESKNSQ